MTETRSGESMSTRQELIDALTTKLCDPDKKDLTELLLDALLDRLKSEDIQQLLDAYDDGRVDRLETILFRILERRGL
jgi:hypothetical protein